MCILLGFSVISEEKNQEFSAVSFIMYIFIYIRLKQSNSYYYYLFGIKTQIKYKHKQNKTQGHMPGTEKVYYKTVVWRPSILISLAKEPKLQKTKFTCLLFHVWTM